MISWRSGVLIEETYEKSTNKQTLSQKVVSSTPAWIELPSLEVVGDDCTNTRYILIQLPYDLGHDGF